jgi:hypothetical protein
VGQRTRPLTYRELLVRLCECFEGYPTQVEVQALRDTCEELADDVRALSALAHALRGALVAMGVVKGGA